MHGQHNRRVIYGTFEEIQGKKGKRSSFVIHGRDLRCLLQGQKGDHRKKLNQHLSSL